MYTERFFYLAFSLVPRIGPLTFDKILSFFKNAENAWNASQNAYEEAGFTPLFYKKFDEFRASFDLGFYITRLHEKQVEFVCLIDRTYPPLLKNLSTPPPVLFMKGNIQCLNCKPILGVVGSRKVTSYGRSVTEKLVRELVPHGFTIVSGLALGVDAIAHKATLSSKGHTIAVLACGVDCCNPHENEQLYQEILENDGLIVSEYPLSQAPNLGTFPARNRIIAGLSQGVLVTEARVKSGSLITAHNAQQLKRPVFAVPGPPNSSFSEGTAQLIQNHATRVSSIEDVLSEFNIQKTSI